mgnify:CR=1 FL=1|jgi:hypothetical protein
MLKRMFTVPELAVDVATGETCYSRENGFSAISARVAPEDAQLAENLTHAQKHRHIVTLRCAMLDVTGKITNCLSVDGKKSFVLSVDDIVYRKPVVSASGLER